MVDQSSIKNLMWESTKDTFETMISLPVEKTDEEYNESDPSRSVISTITFTGPIKGVFALQCSMVTAEKIAKAMLMSGPDDPISEAETNDALGEVVNMLIGGVKARTNDDLSNIQISIPSIIKGVEIQPSMGRSATMTTLSTKVDGQIMKLTFLYKAES